MHLIYYVAKNWAIFITYCDTVCELRLQLLMNGSKRTACFAKAIHNYTFSLWTVNIYSCALVWEVHWITSPSSNCKLCLGNPCLQYHLLPAQTFQVNWVHGRTDGQTMANSIVPLPHGVRAGDNKCRVVIIIIQGYNIYWHFQCLP